MEIRRQQHQGFLELFFEGRLDGYWAQHLVTTVGEVMREGAHSVRVNLSGASYISSAGIGSLVQIHKQFTAIGGSFSVVEPSRQVKQVLEMVGLSEMLASGRAMTSPPRPVETIQRKETGGAVFEIQQIDGSAELTCRLIGQPGRLAAAGYSEDDCSSLALSEKHLALGLGAFGDSFASCRDRFGEFLAAGGAAAAQPTDGSNFPDYMLASGSFVPNLATLYGLCCEGDFSGFVRFESSSGKDPVPLSLIIETCVAESGAPAAAIVIVAESAGLMGAALKSSPATRDGKPPEFFGYPGVRQWLSFSPERCFPHSLVMIAGLAASNGPAGLKPFVRPIRKGSLLSGHFHAAAFGYKPLQKGRVEMRAAVRSLFDAGGLQGVVHILADDRETAGAGESELLRGACWVGPIRKFTGGGEVL